MLTDPMARALEVVEENGAMSAARLDRAYPDSLVRMSEQLYRLGYIQWAGWRRYSGTTRYLFCKPTIAGRQALAEWRERHG